MDSAKPHAMFRVPVKWIPEERFAAIDFGTSLLKVVYVARDDRDKLKSSNKEDLLDIHVATFPLCHLDKALDMMVAKCLPTKGGSGLEFLGTGLGTGLCVPAIQKKLGVKILMPMEFDAFIDASFKLITTFPREDIMHPLSVEPISRAGDICKAFSEILGHVESTSTSITYPIAHANLNGLVENSPLKGTPDTPYAQADQDLFPYLLVMAGSTFCLFQVNADGKAISRGLNQRGGRTFLGLGCLLLGVESHDEILALAENGDNSQIDILLRDGVEGNVDDGYAVFQKADKMVRAYFGKLYGTPRDGLKKEDIARAWVCMAASDWADWVFTTAVALNLKRALVCGSTLNHPLVRQEMLASFHTLRGTFTEQKIELQFIQNGGHLGALGALMCQSHDRVPVIPAPQKNEVP